MSGRVKNSKCAFFCAISLRCVSLTSRASRTPHRTRVDDFGTGYSSLYYLKNLPLDEIKIDQSYIRDLLEDANDAAIVESIIAIARNLKLRTVAEGVETAAQADILRAMGCSVHQGYHYSRPLPLDEFEAFTRL